MRRHPDVDALGSRSTSLHGLGWTGRRTAVARQQTLQATLDWSYDLLSETERRTFERLSVFLGPFSLEAALAVGAGDDLDAAAVAMALDALIAKKRDIKQARSGLQGTAGDSESSWLVGFASQSGFAEQLHWQTAGQLQAAGLPVKVPSLDALCAQELGRASGRGSV